MARHFQTGHRRCLTLCGVAIALMIVTRVSSEDIDSSLRYTTIKIIPVDGNDRKSAFDKVAKDRKHLINGLVLLLHEIDEKKKKINKEPNYFRSQLDAMQKAAEAAIN